MLKTLFVVAIVVGLPAFSLLRFRAASRRRAGFRTVGRQFGLSYGAYDLDGMSQQPFSLFRKGDGRSIENVLAGEWKGRPVTAFDFSYWEAADRSARHSSARRTRRFQCALAPIDAFCPRLTIEREGLASRIADGLGLEDIQFESAAFNRAFRVACEDRRFAIEILDARMMAWLLDATRGYEFEVAGSQVLVWGSRVAPTAIVPLLGTATGFAHRIPRVVRALYGFPAAG